VYIFIAWGKKLSNFCIHRKTLGRYNHKLSIISKQSRLMHKELRYQVKTHAISDMPRKEKKNLLISPFFLLLLLNKMLYGNDIICKAWSNLCRLDVANTEKQSLDLLFLSSPNSTYNILSREIGAKTQLVPRLHNRHKR
jgi:hypothetical protein